MEDVLFSKEIRVLKSRAMNHPDSDVVNDGEFKNFSASMTRIDLKEPTKSGYNHQIYIHAHNW